MITIEISIIIILICHFISDFIIQSDEQAKGKSTSIKQLTSHIIGYTLCMAFGFLLLYTVLPVSASSVLYALLITFAAHWVTDYFTSRINKKLWESGDTHNFFVGIGADQLLHAIQLILTIKFLYYV